MRPFLRSICLGAASLALLTTGALAQTKEFKIGVLFDETGPFAGGGSKANLIGTKLAIDYINEKGGVEGYKIVPTYADAQSKVDIAINEAERLLNEAKVDMLMGVYSSAQCVPLAAKVDAAQKFWWATVCVSSAVFKDKNLKYVFRPTIHSDQYGQASCIFLSEVAKEKLGKDAKDVKVAIINEDGPYGLGVAQAAEDKCKELGLQIVHREGYAATSTDLSALVTKLRRAKPDVVLHAGYNPDITLFLRQSKEANFKFSALIGHGAGYSQYSKLEETFGKDVNLVMDVDPVASQILDPKTLKPGVWRHDPGDAEALGGPGRHRRRATPSVDGLQQHLRIPDRRAAARDQEVRRHRLRGRCAKPHWIRTSRSAVRCRATA